MSIWLNGGSIVTDTGNVVLCDDCPCGSQINYLTGCTTTNQSLGCASVPECWKVTITGFVDGTICSSTTFPGHCSNINGVWYLVSGFTGTGGCCTSGTMLTDIFRPSEIVGFCGGYMNPLMSLCGDGVTNTLVLGTTPPGAQFSYTLSVASWDCAGVNIMNIDTGNSLVDEYCGAYPTTIRVEPANCP